jgi:RNA polymerase sigma factor (sigma-70 family)
VRDSRKVRSYLFTTAHNLVRNHYRRSSVSPFVATEADLDVADTAGSDARARLRSLVDRLTEVLQSMPKAHRQAFELGVLDKLPYREIARQTGWTAGQVKINVYRARKRVIEELAEDFGELGET